MKKVKIKKTKNATTQTSTPDVKQVDLIKDTRQHQKDVYNIMSMFSENLLDVAVNHDYTKIDNIDDFYKDFKNTIVNKLSFGDMPFYKKHYETERHHIKSRVPEDVNLFDIIEMLSDCIAAGLSRSGNVYDVDVDGKTLERALKNTQKWIMDRCEVEDVGE